LKFCRWGILTRPQVGDFKVAIRDPKEIVNFKEMLIVEMIEIQAITQLLIEKGIITKEEYFTKLKDVQMQYEERQKNVVV
jgi:hypothetical protein